MDDILNQNIILSSEDSFTAELTQQTAKKPRLSLEPISDGENLWPDEYNEGDSIFSDILPQQILPSDRVVAAADEEVESTDSKDNVNDPLQCTQRFLDDLAGNDDIGFTKYMCGSQYRTREELLERQKSLKSFVQEAIQDIGDITWHSQAFPCEGPLFLSKGPFYGLPTRVEKMIYEQKRIGSLYDWQKECLRLPAIEKRRNLIYSLPTSGGKTLVAEIIMLREILCREKNVMFVLPYVSIVQEKVSAMSPFAYNLDFLIEEYTAGRGRCPPMKRRKRRTIYICSIEKGAILLDSLIEAKRVKEVGLVVVDELHLIGERGRGASLEALLAKIKFIRAGIQIVGMSATIGNLPEVAEFLDADVYTRGFRPVELQEYIKCGKDILKIDANGMSLDEIFVYERTVNFKYSPNVAKTDPDHLAGLVSEIIPKGSCLIFCSTRKNCENVAVLLTKVLSQKIYVEHRKNDRLALIDAMDKLCGTISPVLSQTIPYGIAYHHSGLTSDERRLLETGYRLGTLCVICCTSTLAAGVNLPAKRVIIRAPYVGRHFMTLCKYKQMVGRAGRAGMGETGESILICSSKDNLQVGQMLFSPMDQVESSMLEDSAIGLENLILSAIGLNLASSLKDLLQLVRATLLAVQCGKLSVSVEQEVTAILRNMFRHKILTVSSPKPNGEDIMTTQEIRDRNLSMTTTSSKYLVLSKSTKFELTIIGKAAYKAGVDYKKAESIYAELKAAQSSLALRNFSHLLYLVVCYSCNDDSTNIILDPTVFFREYNKLDKDTLYVAKMLGINEVHAVKMARTMSVTGPIEKQVIRFYKVLILSDLISLSPTHVVAAKYRSDRGAIQTLMNQSISAAGSIIRLCEQINEFWCYTPLFEMLFRKLDYCCTIELAPLLDLPCVKINRAKQLYNAGFKTIEDIAKAKSRDLCRNVEHLSHRTAQEIVSAAKVILLNKLEVLQEETEAIIGCLQ